MAKHAVQDCCVLRRILCSIASLIVGAALIILPAAAAHAAFSTSATATVTTSTQLLAAPDPAKMTVDALCTLNGGGNKRQLDISVSKFAAVPGANYHSLTIADPAGTVQQSADLTTTAGRSYSKSWAAAGVWTYEVRGDYRVPGSTNTWRGNILRGTVTCP